MRKETLVRLTGAALVATGIAFGSYLPHLAGPSSPVSHADADSAVKYGPNLRAILSRDLADQTGRPGVLDASTLSLIIRTRSDISARLRSLGVNVRTVASGTVMTADVPIVALVAVAHDPDVIGLEAPVTAGPSAGLVAMHPSPDPAEKYGPGLRALIASDGGSPSGNLGAGPVALSVIIRTEADVTARLAALGARIRSNIGGTIVTADVPMGALATIAQQLEVIAIEAAVMAGPMPGLTAAQPTNTGSSKYGPNLRSLLSSTGGATPGGRLGTGPATIRVIIRTETDISGRLLSLGAELRSIIDGTLVTADVPVSILAAIAAQPEVSAIESPVAAGPAPAIGADGRIFLPLVARR